MTKTFLGSSKTNKNGIATFNYHGEDRGYVDIIAIAKDEISQPCRILDYTFVVIKDINIDENGDLIIEFSPILEMNDENFIIDINIDQGILIVDESSNISNFAISEINDSNGDLIINNIDDIFNLL